MHMGVWVGVGVFVYAECVCACVCVFVSEGETEKNVVFNPFHSTIERKEGKQNNLHKASFFLPLKASYIMIYYNYNQERETFAFFRLLPCS